MILPAAYIPSAMIIDKFPKRWDKRIVIISGMVFCALSLFFVGPSTLINFNEDKTLAIMIAGQVLLGLAIPIGLILALPSMVESVMDVYPNQVGRVNNLSSGVFGATSGLGEVIGPLFGATMYEYTGFRMTSDMTAMVTFFYVFLFIFVISNGMDSIKNTLSKRSEEESKEDEGDLTDGKNPKGKKNKSKKIKEDDAVSYSSESLLSQNQSEPHTTYS